MEKHDRSETGGIKYWEKEWPKSAEAYEKAFDKRHKHVISKHFIGHVLDLGCGTGLACKYAEKYTGIDYSSEGIKIAKEQNPNGEFMVADCGQKLDLKGRYDTVLLSEVVEHLENYHNLLVNAQKYADKRIIITLPQSMPNPDHWWPFWTLQDIHKEFDWLGEITLVAKVQGNFWIIIIEKDVDADFYKVNI